MNTVYRFRIYPNKAQRELFAKTFGCVRLVYNRMLAEKKAHYEKTGKHLSLTPARYKSEFPWLKEVDSWVSEIQIKKEICEKLYNQLCEWKHRLTKWKTETSKSWLGPNQTTSED